MNEGYVKILGDSLKTNIWFDVLSPSCHVDVISDEPIEIAAQYESWRTNDEIGAYQRNIFHTVYKLLTTNFTY